MTFVVRLARSLVLSVAMAIGLGQPAAAAVYYLDNTLGELTAEQKATVANPQPVQLLFQLQSNGRANPKGSAFLKEKVVETVKSSGLFSEVSEGPVDGGAVLSITINNVPEEGAASKGVGVGLTFGLVGTKVTDFYVGAIEYLPPQGGAKITKTVNHAIHATVGLKSAPPEGTRMKNVEDAIFTMTRQLVEHGVNELAQDPAFSGATTVSTPAQAAPQVVPVEEAPAAAEPQALPAEAVPAAAEPAASDEAVS